MLTKDFLQKNSLLILLVCAFVIRLYGFSNPIADWHSWRQADTSAVSRNFVKQGYDILHPRFDDLSNVASGKDNPLGYRFVEFPLYNLLQALTYQIIGVFTLEQWGRLVTIFSSLASISCIYLLVKKYASTRAGFLAALFYAVLPYNIYYGRVILPDPSMVAASLLCLYFFDRWISAKNPRLDHWFFLTVLSGASALLLKPYAVFFLLPVVISVFQKYHLKSLIQWKLWLMVLGIIIPLIWWRQWMTQYPEGIPVNTWLMNGNGIRFRPAFFRWIGYERIIKLIAGHIGLLFLMLGTYQVLQQKNKLYFASFLVGSLAYVTIFATGNVQHDYYQILIMPTIAIFMGLGAEFLLTRKFFNASFVMRLILVVGIMLVSFYGSWQQVKGYFNVNNPSIVTAGQIVDKITPPDAKIVALYDGDTSFLYQTNRQGWPTLQNGLEDLITQGADYLVFANPTPDNYKLGEPYRIVTEKKRVRYF